MNKKDLPKHLRMLLYGKVDSDELTQEFERVLELCGCEDYDVNIVENETVIIVDVSPCIQYIKTKGANGRIYEMIPLDSPLHEFCRRVYYDKKRRNYVQESKGQTRRGYGVSDNRLVSVQG